MPTSPAQLHGTALIAPTYRIIIKVLPPSSSGCFFTHVHAVDNAAEVLPTRQHRSFGTTTSDWIYENFNWNSNDLDRGLNIRPRIKCELERDRDREYKEKVREIRNLAQQKDERVPDKREALAMAWMTRNATRAVGRVMLRPEFGVENEKEFLVVSSRSGVTVEASLCVDGKEEQRFIVKGVGDNHFEAVMMLEDEVLIERSRPQKEVDKLVGLLVLAAGVEEDHAIVEADEETWSEDETSDAEVGEQENKVLCSERERKGEDSKDFDEATEDEKISPYRPTVCESEETVSEVPRRCNG